AYQKLLHECQFTRTWGDCYGHMMVATGRAEIMMDPKMNLWDVAAIKPIIEEAGGNFFNWNGRKALHIDDAIACNSKLEAEILELLK
ncbi:inositol monophosphatase, partial [bacterium]|nr:inositol monophosphatase [bacterium]